MDVSIICPIRDEQGSLRQLAAEIHAAMDGSPEDSGAWELVFVDDGSRDGSWGVLAQLAVEDARVRAVRLRRNLGKSAALAAGLDVAEGVLIVMIDGDLQDDPAEIPGMLERLREGSDLVAGSKIDRCDPFTRRLASRIFNGVTGLVTGLKLRDHNCGLKAGRREVFEHAPLYGELHRYLAAISYTQGFIVVEHPVHHRQREHGRSKFGLERYLRGALDLLTAVTLTRYSRRPGHLFGGLGVVLGGAGMAALLYLTGVWFLTDEPIGSRPLLLLGVLLVIFGLQLLSVGLLAELIVNRDSRTEDPLREVSGVVGVSLSPFREVGEGHAGEAGIGQRVQETQRDRE